MFSSLITPVLDMHIKDMDKSHEGINGRMQELNRHLKVFDYELWKKLEDESVNPQFYSFRWLALMLSQEFGLYETTKLWDTLLSYDGAKRFKYLFCLCLAILKIRKRDIMKAEFTDILPKLQKLKDLDVTQILEIGSKMYDKIHKADVDKLLKKQEQHREEKGEDKSMKAMAGKLYNAMTSKSEELFSNLSSFASKMTR